ncbi:MAG: hypothetical protein IKP33_04605 [Prevotella sp.]|nr:hypothetical protein [Prevotella sp.]MBR6938776.1 hypothetical protein [Prevotella sp.]
MMKRYAIPLVKTFGSAALSNVRMILSSASNTKMLLSFTMLVMMMLAPKGVRADIQTTTYDFIGSINAGNTTVTMSGTYDQTYTNCEYFTAIGNVSGANRFAAQGAWILTEGHKQGLYSDNSGGRRFLVSKLSSSDVVTFDVVDIYGTSQTISLESTNATASGNTFTMKGKGALVVNITRYWNIRSITIKHDTSAASWTYDPAIEIYDLSGITGGTVSATNDAGYSFSNGFAAKILDNPSGYSLNNRIAVMNTDFTWSNGLQNSKSNANRLIAINNLKADDRVVITFSGDALFTSHHTNTDQAFSAAGNVFKDDNNDGELNDGEKVIEVPGTAVESGAVYTMTADGHLDIALGKSAKITKIEIYSDHQATMEDRYNGSAATGYTAYFSQTGQLIAKEHIVPGGLEVHIGNSDESQHAEVVMSDEGPVSFVYDQGHYKMARQSNNGMNVNEAIPVTGTFYKFIPEVNGYMSMNFKAFSISYGDYWNTPGNVSGNEHTNDLQCPYYLMVMENNSFHQYVHPNGNTENAHNHWNGHNGSFNNIRVEAGKVYYMYGWWNNTNLAQPGNACGVAHLIDVTFIPDNMVTPLAKWVESSTASDEDLADVTGFTTNDLHIKKLSSNITGCEPYIEGGKLKIRNITFADGANPGGTILIKLGDPSNDANPVFAYTIAYDASWQSSNWTDNSRSEGHTWDFSTNPLRGLDWDDTSGQADDVDFGTEAGPGLLYDEMHEWNPDGTVHTDWMKTWRVINVSGVGTHDLMFLNKYDMEGDNADMMWDTEGLIFNTASNQSCINNEFGGVVDHSKEGTRNDPDRYVGILPGGSFTIPALKAGDRVEIFMGSGDGSGANACKFNITGALDAIGKTISSSDIYNGGGSHWDWNMGGESRYRGAYQFISTGGDMTFTMNGGSMTKLYSIRIYSGAKTATVDCTRNQSQTYNNEVYDGYTYSFVNDWRTTTPAKSAITLHYRGKGERLKTPTVLYKSGNVSTGSDNLFYAEIGDNKAPFIFYKSKKEDYGMFRMRVEDYELNNKYVADYALQNITVGYLIKKNYPYTWDFTDLTGYVETDARITGERTNVDNYDPRTVDENETYEIEFMNNSVGEDVKAVEQWKEYDADGDIPAGYGLHINNEPYGGGCMWAGGQLYANEQAFDETFGLSILPPLNSKGETDVNYVYNGGARICEDGLCLTGGNWRILIPLVGGEKVASVYIRAKQVGSRTITAGVGNAETAFTYVGTATDGTGDKIYAVTGTGDDMTLFFNNLIIKKIAISQDSKTVNKLGYATESRNVEIDPELMGYMTGTGLKAYTVTNVTYGNKAGDIPSITLTEIPKANVMGPATAGDHRGYIIYNTDETAKAVNILDGGFHLFVPDMHDISSASNAKKSILETEDEKNYLRSHINSGSISQTDGDYTNYLMNYKYIGNDGKQHEGPEAFYRAGVGASLGANKAYLQLLTEKVKPTNYDGVNPAKFAIIFVDEELGTVTTSLNGVESTERTYNDDCYYTLDGVKVMNPTKKGIYIKNGKKIIIK